MIKVFPKDRDARQKLLLEQVERIGPILQASGAKSEELGTLAPEAVAALREAGMSRLKLPAAVGGAEADPITEMLVLEGLAYHDLASGWCTMVGATGIASLGAFLPQAGLDEVFANGRIPTAAISFFPAGRAVREPGGFRLNRRWRFNSGIWHSEWFVGGTVVEGTEAENGGRPTVMFSALPAKDVALYDNWGGVTGLRGTGSCDCSVEDYFLPERFSFVWDLLKPRPRRGGPSYLLPPFSYVAKEHGSVAIGAARRALDEWIKIATSTRGTFRSSKLEERHVVHRQIAEADLKLRSAPRRAGANARALRTIMGESKCWRVAGRRRHRRRARHRRACRRCGDRNRHHGLSFLRRHRPASSTRARAAVARPQHCRHAPGDERHGLREPRQIPARPAGGPVGLGAADWHSPSCPALCRASTTKAREQQRRGWPDQVRP
jgi:alkylation response protein AidB-like acyl-CoA dehydrogenase